MINFQKKLNSVIKQESTVTQDSLPRTKYKITLTESKLGK